MQDNFGKPPEAYIVMLMPPNVLYQLEVRWARDYDLLGRHRRTTDRIRDTGSVDFESMYGLFANDWT